MLTLEEYIEKSSVAHGHACARQVLGIRLALLGLRELGIKDPIKQRKEFVTFVEIDRCATDAIQLVTGCRLGKRALKFKDFGKMAATFVDLKSGEGVRIAALDSSKQLAKGKYPGLSKEEGQQRAYRELTDEELFTRQRVKVEIPEEELPGYRASRAACDECGEGINFRREVVSEGRTLCRACAGESYYRLLES
jgi:formylmethanofuran dehydrogenase subunit E